MFQSEITTILSQTCDEKTNLEQQIASTNKLLLTGKTKYTPHCEQILENRAIAGR